MQSGIKYVALGLLVGALSAGLFGVALFFFAPAMTPTVLAPFTSTVAPAKSGPILSRAPSVSPTIASHPTFTPLPTLAYLGTALPSGPTATPDVVQAALD